MRVGGEREKERGVKKKKGRREGRCRKRMQKDEEMKGEKKEEEGMRGKEKRRMENAERRMRGNDRKMEKKA